MTVQLSADRSSGGKRLSKLIAAGCAKASPANPEGASTDAWYAVSYQPILALFAQTRSVDAAAPAAVEAAWAQRKAMVSSWLRGIPKTGIDSAAAKRLLDFERKLANATLADDVFPDIGLAPGEGDPVFPLRHLLGEANRVLNRSASVRLASSTKLLHFMLPELVPIIDTNVSQNLFDKKEPTVAQYLEYVRLLRAYLREGEHRHEILKLAAERGVSPVRLVDTFVFRRGDAGEETEGL